MLSKKKKSYFNWKLLTSKRYGNKKYPLQEFSVGFISADAYLEFVGHFPNPSDMHLVWGMNPHPCAFIACENTLEAEMQAVVKGTSET